MRRKIDLTLSLAWIRREPPGPPPDDLRNQFWERCMDFLAELWAFLKVRKKFWLLPIILVMLLIGGLLILGEGSVIAPFIYTLF
jgi:hypothetical protein